MIRSATCVSGRIVVGGRGQLGVWESTNIAHTNHSAWLFRSAIILVLDNFGTDILLATRLSMFNVLLLHIKLRLYGPSRRCCDV